MPVDLRRLRQFIVLADTLNFRRAAEKLHMAQPPLSMSIQKLETELGVKLFSRGIGGVALTANGQVALDEAKRLLFHGEQFVEIVSHSAFGTRGVLKVGFVGSTTHGLLQKLVTPFRMAYPNIELTLREATSTHIVELVENNELDLGLVRTPLLQNSSVSLAALEDDEFVAAVPRGGRLARKSELRLSELAREPFVMYSKTDAPGLFATATLACQECGFLPLVAQEATQIQTVLALVESGLGIALVPSIMRARPSRKIAYRKLTDLPGAARIGLALAYRADMESGVAQRFRRLATATLEGSRPRAEQTNSRIPESN